VNQRRELEAALAAAEAERTRASAIEQQVADARAEGESERTRLAAELAQERAAVDSERAAADQLRQTSAALEQQLAAARAQLSAFGAEQDAARRDIDTVRGELDAVRRELEVARDERDSMRGERDAATRDLETARGELDGIRQDAHTRTQTLSRSQAEHELALKTAQDGARGAGARLADAIRERDAAQHEATELKRQLEEAETMIRERDALQRELRAAHDARDAAEAREAVRNISPNTDIDGDSETVVDLTIISKEEERQLAFENRIRALELALRDAETRAESAELELDQQRRPAPEAKRAVPISVATRQPAPAPASVPVPPSEVTDGSMSEQYRGAARAAKRVQFNSETDIQIDGTPGKLVDLSLTGAQVLTPTAMKPHCLIKVALPMGDTSLSCNAKVMWSRLEPRSGKLWYRAGVSFTSADQAALQAFLGDHAE
jgi:hypothetical protein